MVCILEEGRAVCIIQDLATTTTGGVKNTLSLPASTTVQELFQEVGKIFQYDPESFELILQRTSDGESIILNEHKEKTIDAVGVNFEPGARNIIIITDMPTAPRCKVVPVSADAEDDMQLGASASPTATTDYTHPPPAPPPPPPAVGSGDYSYATALIKHNTGYVGLVNQAMTCYLNSLLQALYMTPEFRNALYKWEFDGTEAEAVKSIPYQLQKLFLNLQTSSKSAVETTELTRSFGWDSSEAWQQHDIQELCRVMFDALEQKFKHTDQADLIQRLYEGKMTDYVKCLECGTEKSREDTFLDIPLPVRPFGSAVAYGSVEEALRAFVQPETLDGNNQYYCEKCNKKCDAHKGLKFSKFPYLLTLHLKRFDFDYTTLHRIKLNDKVVFLETLNLNSVIACAGNKEDSDGIPEESAVKCDDSSTTDSGSALDDESCQGTETVLSTQDADYQEDDEGIDMSNGPNHHENEKNRRHTLEKGPYMYELFSIMIHSGSASGGHYYAYIKDFKKGDWFCFNDQSVSRITYDDIKKTYGGGPMRSYYSGAYSSSTNAYMLMYRQIDKQRNCEAMSVDEFPAHIKDLLQKVQKREESDRILREKEMDTCKIKLYAHHPTQHQVVEAKVYCGNKITLQETTELAHKKLRLEGVVPLERCRLVNYDRLQDTIECSFEGRDNDPIGDIVNSLHGNYKCDLLLEIRKEDAEFEVYQPGGVAMKVFVVDVETEEVDGPTIVRGNLSQTVAEFKVTLAKALHLDPKTMKVVLEKYSSEPKLLDNDDKTLKFEGFYGSNKVFVASYCDDDPEKPFVISKLHKIIDRFEHIVSLRMVLPDTDKETLEKLQIPVLNLDVNHNSSGNSKLPEESSTNEEPASGGGGDSASALCVTSPACSGNPLRDSSPQPPGDTEDEGIGATGHSDQSASEDSSLTDSDRTLVGDAPDDGLPPLSSSSSSPPGSDRHNISSPEEANTNTYHSFTKEQTENWDDEENDAAGATTRSTNCYFRAVPYTDNDNQRMLKVLVDKRMFLGTLKKDLEPYVGVPVQYFKIYRLNTGQQEFECARPTENLGSYRDDEKLTIRLDRVLRKGEHRGKVFQLLPNSPEPIKFLCDWILGKGMTVGDVKKEILEEIKRKYSIDIPYERCRLRKKSWKNPAEIYLNDQRFEHDISLFPNWEMFLQELPEPEKVTSSNQLVLFVRRWCPANLELKSFEEVLLDELTALELKTKLSNLSGIPVEYVEFAKGQGSFPCEMSVLGIHAELDWNTETATPDNWPPSMFEDGHVILYRDSREELKQLSGEERKEIANKEVLCVTRLGTRLGTTVSTYSPRKERALKIYLDTSPRRNNDVEVD